jgi:hypothetical protein
VAEYPLILNAAEVEYLQDLVGHAPAAVHERIAMLERLQRRHEDLHAME